MVRMASTMMKVEEAVATEDVSKIRWELELVLRDRAKKGPYKDKMTDLVDKALYLFDLEIKDGIPIWRAFADTCVWYGREEVHDFGY